MKISPLCICQPKKPRDHDDPSPPPSSDGNRDNRAQRWLYTLWVVTSCALLPLASFLCDVGFYGVAANKYYDVENAMYEIMDGGGSLAESWFIYYINIYIYIYTCLYVFMIYERKCNLFSNKLF